MEIEPSTIEIIHPQITVLFTMFSAIFFLFAFAIIAAAQTPSPTYPNGTANPFYPCGSTASEVTTCPYRCYTAEGALESGCFTETAATTAIDSLKSICVECVVPDVPEDYPGGCQPLSNYFSGAAPPSPCGFKNHRLRECAWICEEAQVPFDSCSATNDTGEYELCEKCVPQCSSPRIIFEPPSLPSNFSLSTGSCSTEYGNQEVVACPFRCTTAGRPDAYCSLVNGTNTGAPNYGFTTCTSCQ